VRGGGILRRIWVRWVWNWLKAKLKRKEKKLVGNWAVLLIDMQKGYRDNFSDSSWEGLVTNQLEIINCCADCDIPLVVVEYAGCGATDGILIEAIKRAPRSVRVVKSGFDAFGSAMVVENSCAAPAYIDLVGWLRHWKTDSVFLMGIYACGCVEATAKGALINGLKIATAKKTISNCGATTYGWYRQYGLVFRNFRKAVEALRNNRFERGVVGERDL
jgi:nicotinamidase-related amidase